MEEPEPPVGPLLSPQPPRQAAVAAHWRAIERRLDAAPGRARAMRWVFGGVAAAALAGAGATALVVMRSHATNGSSVAGTATASPIVLSDGSEVVVDPAGRVVVKKDDPREVHLDLAQGGARFVVTHDVTRPFSVDVRDVTVHVVGTEFRVAIEGDGEQAVVRVAVDRGIVEVTTRARPDEVRRLLAGESWSTRTPAVPASAVAPADTGTPESQASDGEPAPSAGASGAPAPTTARALFEAANQARHAGRVDAAARLYRELLARFPDDPRAKLAAFELGRLELSLGRGGDAQKALEQAAEGPSGSSVHEDALAKLVALHDERGDLPACRRARAEYLKAYPKGIHAAAVARSCSAR